MRRTDSDLQFSIASIVPFLSPESVGVMAHSNCWYNQGYLLPLSVPQTSQSAEVHSTIPALKVARAILQVRWKEFPGTRSNRTYNTVILFMDSSYVVQAMSEWIRKWRANGFRNARGERVANIEALQTLDNEIRRLFDDHSVMVRFWQVPRVHNFGADWMAAEALRKHRIASSDSCSELDILTRRFARVV